MTNPSNLYAEKAFSEHPIALWALDDQVDYVSLLTESDRDLTTWSVSGGTAQETTVLDAPFSDSQTTLITGNLINQYSYIELISPDTINIDELNTDFATFSIGTYFYSRSIFIGEIQIGYRYYDSSTSQYVINFPGSENPTISQRSLEIPDNWIYVADTFNPPVSEGEIQVVIRIGYLPGAVATTDNEFLINGVSMGQWAEEFSAESLGIQKITLPTDIALPATDAIEADAYGLVDTPGYYLITDNALMARNAGVPLIYGSKNITTLFDNGNLPSMIVPGYGFLNEVGQFKNYTFEMWIRLNPDTDQNRRIFGPIASEDGLYVKGSHLILKIGDNIDSYFVGEWYRPMLLQIEMIQDSVSMIVNGEQVISMDIDTAALDLPSEFDNQDKSQDWLGFYAHDDVYPIDLDCIALYSYQIPSIVAKRRWVFGQGVEFPENINTSYSGTSTLIDFPFANYSNTYSYPDLADWNQGFSENFNVDGISLSTPEYGLPLLQFNNKSEEEWLTDSKTIQTEDEYFINLRPDSGWDSTDGHLLIENLNLLTNSTRSIYGVFKETEAWTADQTLIHIQDNLNSNYFAIILKENTIDYVLKSGTATTVQASVNKPAQGTEFAAGINIRELSDFFGNSVATFFGRTVSLSAYIGGKPNFTETFTGNIYRITLDSPRNTSLIIDSYGTNGIITEIPQEHKGSYDVLPTIHFGNYELSYNSYSFWEDYIPLTYLGKFVLDESGDQYYDIDLIQFNIDFPASSKYIEDDCDTSKSLVKTYISFQYIESGSNASSSSFANTECPPANGVVNPGEEWINTRYEVVDNNIIYPPIGVDFNLISMVIHVESEAEDVSHLPISIRSLEVASQAFNNTTPKAIGTRFGVPIYPYKRSGVYFDYKTKNPYTIYKQSSPYLYLTRTSGIEVKGDFEQNIARGLSIPVNLGLSENFRVIAMQMAMRYDRDSFPTERTELFEIQSNNTYIKFYLEPIDPQGRRAKIVPINANTNAVVSGMGFYWNGNLVSNPIITTKEWGILGISFANILNFDNFAGAIRLTGPVLFNNISHYQSTNLQEVQNTSFRNWLRVKFLGTEVLNWTFWDSAYTWEGVLVLSAISYYGVEPEEIYRTYTGTNKFIIDDTREFTVENYEYVIKKEIDWSSTVISPA